MSILNASPRYQTFFAVIKHTVFKNSEFLKTENVGSEQMETNEGRRVKGYK